MIHLLPRSGFRFPETAGYSPANRTVSGATPTSNTTCQKKTRLAAKMMSAEVGLALGISIFNLAALEPSANVRRTELDASRRIRVSPEEYVIFPESRISPRLGLEAPIGTSWPRRREDTIRGCLCDNHNRGWLRRPRVRRPRCEVGKDAG